MSLKLNIWPRIHVGMDEMYETARQAKNRYLGIDEINVQNWRWMKCAKFAAKLASEVQIIALYHCTNNHMI